MFVAPALAQRKQSSDHFFLLFNRLPHFLVIFVFWTSFLRLLGNQDVVVESKQINAR